MIPDASHFSGSGHRYDFDMDLHFQVDQSFYSRDAKNVFCMFLRPLRRCIICTEELKIIFFNMIYNPTKLYIHSMQETICQTLSGVSISEQLDVLREQLVEERMQRQVAEFPMDFVGAWSYQILAAESIRHQRDFPEVWVEASQTTYKVNK